MKPSHVIITPWPLERDLHTWCGRTVDDLKGHFIATSPDHVTCMQCARSMRMAMDSLLRWVPSLPMDGGG